MSNTPSTFVQIFSGDELLDGNLLSEDVVEDSWTDVDQWMESFSADQEREIRGTVGVMPRC